MGPPLPEHEPVSSRPCYTINDVMKTTVLTLALCCAAAAGETAKPIIDNQRVTVWDATWTKGTHNPIPRHEYDFVTVYLVGGSIRTTLPNGTSSMVAHKKGDAIF